MKRLFYVIPLVCLLCLGFGCQKGEEVAEEPVVDVESEKAGVRAVLDQYANAWKTLDFEQFSQVFSHDDDMVIFSATPNKRYIGWEEFQADVQESFKEVEKIEIVFRDVVVKVHASCHMAWLSCLEDWDFVYQGQTVRDEGARVSWVLEKREGRWVIIHAHWSMPPEAEETPDQV